MSMLQTGRMSVKASTMTDTTMNIIFQIDTSQLTTNTQLTPGGSALGPNGHPPIIYGYGSNTGAYTHASGDTVVEVNGGDEVWLSLEDTSNNPASALCPTGLIFMNWNSSGKDYPYDISRVYGGDAVIGTISFVDTRADLYDYLFDAKNPGWKKFPDEPDAKDQYGRILNTATLQNPAKRNPCIVLPTLKNSGTLTYGLEFMYAKGGKLFGTYWFDPAIKVVTPGTTKRKL
ncbi:uncharacterized protein SOCE26_031450 [Sorangium cellulosum]|uniref:Uncharacterized protein n=1 Tax=Sorangium cellulosum TaxID=56 RepID=A0A2L0EQZ4_SORCE|nr:hypothetical protein [Sorangium cellulosum]AUX41723.1 uncharacterized protein SOCE26_031450 [Sorangium cellulosum]